MVAGKAMDDMTIAMKFAGKIGKRRTVIVGISQREIVLKHKLGICSITWHFIILGAQLDIFLAVNHLAAHSSRTDRVDELGEGVEVALAGKVYARSGKRAGSLCCRLASAIC